MQTSFLKICFILAPVLSVVFTACENETNNKTSTPNPAATTVELVPMLDYTVVAKYPHDIACFTEGFLFHEGKLFESTGAPENLPQTKSSIGICNLESGKFEQKIEIDKRQYFGEGITFFGNNLYQLTYTNQVGFVYDAKTFERKSQFSYQNKQGWGLTTDGTHLIMSDGTNELSYLNPSDLAVVKKLNVSENGFALDYINELEFIKGFIYANVWMTNFIVKIDPNSGKVVGKLDLSDLLNQSKKANINLLEMNGIAYDVEKDRVLITGKLWPDIYEIKF